MTESENHENLYIKESSSVNSTDGCPAYREGRANYYFKVGQGASGESKYPGLNLVFELYYNRDNSKKNGIHLHFAFEAWSCRNKTMAPTFSNDIGELFSRFSETNIDGVKLAKTVETSREIQKYSLKITNLDHPEVKKICTEFATIVKNLVQLEETNSYANYVDHKLTEFNRFFGNNAQVSQYLPMDAAQTDKDSGDSNIMKEIIAGLKRENDELRNRYEGQEAKRPKVNNGLPGTVMFDGKKFTSGGKNR